MPKTYARARLATTFMFGIIFVAFGLSVIFKGVIGINQIHLGEDVASGVLRLFSILPLFSLVYLFRRWFKFSQISTFDLKTMISLTFGFYALSDLFIAFLVLNTVFNLAQYPSIFHALYRVSTFCLGIIFGLSLLRLSSLMLERQDFDARSLRLTIICLASYGTEGVLLVIRTMLSLFLADIPPYSWIFWFEGVMIYFTFLLLSIDVFLKKRLRKQSVYIAFLSTGVAYLLGRIHLLLRDLRFVIRFPLLNFLLLQYIEGILIVLSYLLVIVVSYSLIRGGRWEGKNLKLSYVAIFLYVSGYLLGYLYLISYNSISLIANPYSIFERTWVGRVIVSGLISLPHLFSLLTIGLLLYREREQWMRVTVKGGLFSHVRSVLTQKRFRGAVSSVTLILLILLVLHIPFVYKYNPGTPSPIFQGNLTPPPPLEYPPSQWKLIANFEDVVGDQIAPNVDINGTAIGGLSYEGADILKATVYSPLFSDKLTITVYLNGNGRGDHTIDNNRTRVYISLWSDKLRCYGYLYYDGHGLARCYKIHGNGPYDSTEKIQWINDNVAKLTFKGLPHFMNAEVKVLTERLYTEEAGTKNKPLIRQELDKLVIKEYVMSLGRTITLLDLTKQLSPLYNSTMKGMDIQTVDVYRCEEYLNITVTLSDPGITDKSIPPTFEGRECTVGVRMKEQNYVASTKKSVSYGWIKQGKQYCIVFNIAELGGLSNVGAIEVETRDGYIRSTVDGNIVDNQETMRWVFDVCYFSFPP